MADKHHGKPRELLMEILNKEKDEITKKIIQENENPFYNEMDEMDDIPNYERKYDSPKYFVFCGQEAGFQTRSILIPWDILTEERKKDIEEIKKQCVEYEGIKNIYFSEIQWEEDFGCHINHKLVSWLYFYADNDWGGLKKIEDEHWYNESYCDVIGGFSHIDNYKELISMKEWKEKPFECVDSILVLEKDVGKEYRKPEVKTVQEMFEKYYG
jgi:hypothetical protein